MTRLALSRIRLQRLDPAQFFLGQTLLLIASMLALLFLGPGPEALLCAWAAALLGIVAVLAVQRWRGRAREVLQRARSTRKPPRVQDVLAELQASKGLSRALADEVHDLATLVRRRVPEHRSSIAAALPYAKVHHDLLGPVGLLKHHLERLPAPDQPPAQACLRHLELLIGAFGDAVRIAGGNWPLPEEEVFVRKELEVCRSSVEPYAAQQGVHLEFKLPADAGSWVGNSVSFRRIAINLLTNAIKACSRAHNGHHTGRVLVQLAREANGILLTVCDNGDGMTPEQRQALFQTKAPPAEGKRQPLGLLTCDDLCRSLGGSIRVASSVRGQGTTMEVRLPAPGARPL